MEEHVRALVRGAIGKICWSAIASDRTDYVIVLEIGAKHRRSMRLANPRLSFLQRTYEGEYSFLVECNWRLDGAAGVVASCYDGNQRGGLMLKALAELEGRKVADARIESIGFDLSINFEGGYALRCLSTETDPRGKRNNWTFWSPQGLVTIGPRGRVSIETASEAEKRFHDLKRSLAQDDEDVVSRFPRDREPGQGDQN